MSRVDRLHIVVAIALVAPALSCSYFRATRRGEHCITQEHFDDNVKKLGELVKRLNDPSSKATAATNLVAKLNEAGSKATAVTEKLTEADQMAASIRNDLAATQTKLENLLKVHASSAASAEDRCTACRAERGVKPTLTTGNPCRAVSDCAGAWSPEQVARFRQEQKAAAAAAQVTIEELNRRIGEARILIETLDAGNAQETRAKLRNIFRRN